jgi:hypothetical protein
MHFHAEIHLFLSLSPVSTLSSGYGVSRLVSSFEFLDLDFLKATTALLGKLSIQIIQ